MSDFNREEAITEIVSKHGLDSHLAAMAVDEDPAIQKKNITSLKAAIVAGGKAEDKDKAEQIKQLKVEYHEARERRDVTRMVSIKHSLGRLGCFTV